jgi:DNA-3-methyladenine glycosylase
MKLAATFFARDTVTVARELLGKRLVRNLQGHRLSGLICETEAYVGEEDTACHASRGCTPRTRVMYGPPGCYYVYLIYGIHHMLNIVTAAEGEPEAVLIRALVPEEGVEFMQENRGGASRPQLANGPGKLCQALAIDRGLNGLPVVNERLWLEAGIEVPEGAILASPRVGIGYAAEKDRKRHWRFHLDSTWLRSL